jgi:hypothetical protein
MGTGAEVALIALAATSAAAAVGSAGLSFYGQQQQAAASQRMAQYNYSVQKAQMEMQNQMAAQGAEAQAKIFGYNAQVAQNEANRTELEARERARRMRSENERMLGLQRASYGKANVTSEGSPLMVMAETAGLGELAVADELYKADAQRSGLFTQAALEQFKGRMARFEGAGYSLNAANAGAFARPALMAGMNEASALRTSSYGSLISGFGSAANSLSSMPMGGGGMQPIVRRATLAR